MPLIFTSFYLLLLLLLFLFLLLIPLVSLGDAGHPFPEVTSWPGFEVQELSLRIGRSKHGNSQDSEFAIINPPSPMARSHEAKRKTYQYPLEKYPLFPLSPEQQSIESLIQVTAFTGDKSYMEGGSPGVLSSSSSSSSFTPFSSSYLSSSTRDGKKARQGNEDALSPTVLSRQGNVLPSKIQQSFITSDGWPRTNDTFPESFPRSRKTRKTSTENEGGEKSDLHKHDVIRFKLSRSENKYRMSTPLVRKTKIHSLLEENINPSFLPPSQSNEGITRLSWTEGSYPKNYHDTTAEVDRTNMPGAESEEVIGERHKVKRGKAATGTNEFISQVSAPDGPLSSTEQQQQQQPQLQQYNLPSGKGNESLQDIGFPKKFVGIKEEVIVQGDNHTYHQTFHINDTVKFIPINPNKGDNSEKIKGGSHIRSPRSVFYSSSDISYEPVIQTGYPLENVNPAAMLDMSLTVPYMRHGREKLSFISKKSYSKGKKILDQSLPRNFSLIFAKNFPKIISNYHSAYTNSHQSNKPRALPQRNTLEDTTLHSRTSKKVTKSVNSHATRPSIHIRSGTNHGRDRLHSKTPLQRHSRSRNRSKRKVTAVEVWSLAGDAALLPCDLSVRAAQDSVQMVMWLKEGSHTPLFSVDYREQAGGRPQVWRDNSSSTACRAHLHLAGVNVGMEECTQHPPGSSHLKNSGFATDLHDFQRLRDRSYIVGDDLDEANVDTMGGLVLRDVELEDSAIYRCRVDFLLTPTRNARVNLTVVVPPSSVEIAWVLDKDRRTDVSDDVGPFREGDSPTLVCYTRAAWPPPQLVWLEEDKLVDDSYKVDPKNEAVVNSITLNDLTRSYHGRRFSCVAANSNLTKPIESTVTVKLALDVLDVRMDEMGVLSAGVHVQGKCTVWGSSPPPTVTWTLGDTPVPEANSWVSEDGNRSMSIVRLMPEPHHDGAILKCVAHNPMIMTQMPGAFQMDTFHDQRYLNVNYAPQVTVTLGRSLDANNIKEGDDLYFECTAEAKPPPHKVTWSHNGEELISGNGILVSNMTLVLQHVARANAGTYTCHATNSEGTAASPPLGLDVKYAPVCASPVASQHSVAKHENARISCNVLANPPVVQFSWAFNNTAEAVTVPDDRYVVQGTESVVNYTPVTELDYGTLLCWATNGIGQQVLPCVFQIIAAGKPDPPHNCRAFDVTISSLQVSCLKGDDGGLGQTFLLQVFEANGDYQSVAEVRRETADFSVANLRPATAYRLLIIATNAKGESRPAELSAYTVALNHPQHETPAEPTRGRETGAEVAVGVLVGAVLACLPVVIIVIVIGVRTCMRVRAAKRRRSQSEDSEKDVTDIEGGMTGRPLINKQGRPGSVGGVSAETGSDITTITGGAGLSSTMPPTPSPPQPHHVTQVPTSESSGVLYPGGRIYAQDPAHELGVQVITGSSSKLHARPYVTMENKCQGESELLEITLPPPAAYDQGYQSSPQMYQSVAPCYAPQEQGSPRLTQGYQHVFQEYQSPGGGVQACHLPTAGYPVAPPLAKSGGPGSTSQISSSVNTAQEYHYPKMEFQETAHKVSSSASFATLPLHNKDLNQENKAHNPDGKMSTVYNPLALFPSSPSYQSKCAAVVTASERSSFHTGSLKRPVKPSGQDIQRIRDTPRNRSASLSTDRSKRESSV